MCGIAAIFNSESKSIPKLDDLASDIMLMTQVRGMDATGILQVTGAYDMEFFKRAVNASDLIQMEAAKKLLNGTTTAYGTIIHCRKKTTGGSNHASAHPFVVYDKDGDPEFGMVHNGTLTRWNGSRHESDSHWLSDQIHADPDKALEDLKGAAALIWTDMRSQEHRFFTNGERPLFYGMLDKLDVMIVGSEAELLYAAITRNGFKLKDDEFFKVKPMSCHIIDLADVNSSKVVEVKKVAAASTNAASSSGTAGGTAKNDNYSYSYGKAWRTGAEMVDQLNGLYTRTTGKSANEDTKSTVTEKPETSNTTRVGTLGPSEEERKNFEELSGSRRAVETYVKLDWYDSASGELYMTVTDIDPLFERRGVVIGDMVVMRDVSTQYFNYLETKFEELCVAVGGATLPTDSSMQSFIATGRPIITASREKTKVIN